MKLSIVEKFKLAIALFAGLAALSYTSISGADDSGAQLAQRLYDRADGKDSTALTTMTLTEPGRSPRVRQLVIYRLNLKPGEIAVLSRFVDDGSPIPIMAFLHICKLLSNGFANKSWTSIDNRSCRFTTSMRVDYAKEFHAGS